MVPGFNVHLFTAFKHNRFGSREYAVGPSGEDIGHPEESKNDRIGDNKSGPLALVVPSFATHRSVDPHGNLINGHFINHIAFYHLCVKMYLLLRILATAMLTVVFWFVTVWSTGDLDRSAHYKGKLTRCFRATHNVLLLHECCELQGRLICKQSLQDPPRESNTPPLDLAPISAIVRPDRQRQPEHEQQHYWSV